MMVEEGGERRDADLLSLRMAPPPFTSHHAPRIPPPSLMGGGGRGREAKWWGAKRWERGGGRFASRGQPLWILIIRDCCLNYYYLNLTSEFLDRAPARRAGASLDHSRSDDPRFLKIWFFNKLKKKQVSLHGSNILKYIGRMKPAPLFFFSGAGFYFH
nr:hypothetical protein [Morchella crassipes]